MQPYLVHAAWLIGAICLGGATLTLGFDNSKTAAEELSQTAYIATMSNIRSFIYVDCEFQIVKAHARNLIDALSGRYVAPIHTRCRWIKSNKIERFFREPDAETRENERRGPKPHPTKKGLGVVQVHFPGVERLINGSMEMMYLPSAREANLLSPEYAMSRGREETPLQVLFDGPCGIHWAMKLVQAGGLTIVQASQFTENNRNLISIVMADPEKRRIEYQLDIDRGFLPIKTTHIDPDGKAFYFVVIAEIKDCTKGRCFPMKIYAADIPMSSNQHYGVAGYEVTKLELDKHPKEEDLAVTLPAGTLIGQRPDHKNFFVTKQIEKIGPNDLANLWTMTERRLNEPFMDTGVARRWSVMTWIWVLILLLLVSGGAYALLARKSRKV